ncbi:uncharacterized protein LOC126576866 [Anopheles aquasalis]|uniref:uncharacterized protein LOC126576866 n=1 Tax=Anopheles aquasalis TaxID=42839 RepID=UPI00215B4D4B|nr:uncharacterized protein LOC126576866 [Anopheles aquasalis]
MDCNYSVKVKIERSEAEAQNVVRENSPTEELIEVIDLTNEEEEFQSFVQSLPQTQIKSQPLPAEPSAPGPSSVVPRSSTRQSYTYFSLPVPVDYVQQIQLNEDFAGGELFKMRFRQLMLYGRLTQKHMKDDSTFIFRLDDGTGQVNVMFRNTKIKIIDTLNNLSQCEELILRREKSAANTEVGYPESLHEPLKTIMAMARANCARQNSLPPYGRGCFVVGFPYQSINGGVAIFAHTVVADTNDKSMDLYWKSYLLSFYRPIVGNDCSNGDMSNDFQSWLQSRALNGVSLM